MNNEVRLLFHRLADLSPEERERTFKELDAEPGLRAEVESLLRFDSAQDSDLTASVGRSALQALGSADVRELSQCGPYRIERLLGVGGMGTVYLAERTDGEVQRKVAVKLLRADEHRAGLHERFLKERQFLASLKHPSIVHMIDAGKTAAGRPYLVMEYVDGTPIDAYAEKVDLRQKLLLFLRVCQGVSHAHQQLIIHRDLKPSNILVDSAGQPKLLDFGIAKLLSETGDQTQTVERLLTPGYASPEQLSGGIQTTATDVYSLGAILYKISAGKLPHESRLPSEVGAGGTEITAARRVNPKIPEDLDYILRKALRHEPEARFTSVEALASDVQALLDSKPVQARSGDAWYRTRKFLRRYWIPVAAALLVVASLSAGLDVANRQRLIAERRFVQLHEVSKKFLDLDLELSEADPRVRIKLVSLSIQYLESLGREALQDRELALEISKAYLTVARIQGVPEWNQLGQYREAEQSLVKAHAFADSVLRADPDNREALWLTANVAHDRAVAAYAERDHQQVMNYPQQVIDTFSHLARLGNLTRREINGATYMYGDMAEVYLGLHRFGDAARFARLGIEVSRETPTVPGPRGQAFNMLAGALMYSGDEQGALDAIHESRKQLETLRRVDRYPRYIALIQSQTGCREGLILGEDGGVNLNRPLDAVAPLEEAFDALEPFALKDLNDFEARMALATAGHYLADVLRHGNPKRALEIYDHSLVRIREIPNDVAARRVETLLLAGSSYAARSTHREKDARERIDAAFRLLRETNDYPVETVIPGGEVDTSLRALADHYAETGQPGKALEIFEDLFSKIMASNPDVQNDLVSSVSVSRLYASRTKLLRRLGRGGEARPLESSRLELWRQWNRKLPGNSFIRRQLEAGRFLP
jgi:serine/threonine protein kinase